MKRLFCVFLSLAMLLTVLVGCNIVPDNDSNDTSKNTESESNTEPQGTVSDNELKESPAEDFEYEINNAGYVLITKYIGNSKNVVLPSEIEGREVVSLKGFQNTNIESVVISDTIRTINVSAFKSCTELTTVTISPNSQLLTIKSGAFEDCSALKSVNIPAKLELRYGDAARFYKVPTLEEIIFDGGRESITGYVFFSITSTVDVIIPESVTNIDMLTFGNTGTLNLYFSGDCPQITNTDMSGNVTVHYDPDMNGWDDCTLRELYPLIPIE